MNPVTLKEIILGIIRDMTESGMTPAQILKEVNLGMGLRQLQRITKDMKVIEVKPYWEKEQI